MTRKESLGLILAYALRRSEISLKVFYAGVGANDINLEQTCMPKMEFHLDLGESYHDPLEFVDAAIEAESLGFRTAWFGDHFVPWGHSGDKSAFVWPVLGVALEKTKEMRMGPLVTTPIGGRYHPALIAQASATLDNMYPGRFLLGVGSGEAVNELAFMNDKWPPWQERIDRLVEGLSLIRKLWSSGEPFTHEGKYFPSDFYYLYTKPKTRIPIYFSAVGKRAAYLAGKFGDHLATLTRETSGRKLREEVIPAYRNGCKEAKKGEGQIVLSVSFTTKQPQELWESRQSFGYAIKDSWSIATPLEVDRCADALTPADLKNVVHFCKNWNDVVSVIEDYKKIGATAIVLGTGLDTALMKQYADNILAVF